VAGGVALAAGAPPAQAVAIAAVTETADTSTNSRRDNLSADIGPSLGRASRPDPNCGRTTAQAEVNHQPGRAVR